MKEDKDKEKENEENISKINETGIFNMEKSKSKESSNLKEEYFNTRNLSQTENDLNTSFKLKTDFNVCSVENTIEKWLKLQKIIKEEITLSEISKF